MPDIRNVAIIAHVDHGKTTLVDGLLKQAGTWRAGEAHAERVMDSMDLERERGITIMSKQTAVRYNGIKINIVDTPGHADFGGEVERIMKMVDAALLLVDASEGPLPQTRFVLGKALEAGLEVLVCINKIDRPDARVDEVKNEIYDLFIDLGASDHQIEFPIFYACAKQGYVHLEPKLEPGDMKPLLDGLIKYIPEPKGDPNEPVQMIVTQLDYDTYVGRLAIGRMVNGTIKKNQELLLVGKDETTKIKVQMLYTFEGLGRVETEQVPAGEIMALAGIDELTIGDCLTDVEDSRPLPRVIVEEPTIGVTFYANTGPLAGIDGKPATARDLRMRLERETATNVALRIDPSASTDSIRLFGRGELQIAILIEQMRREGLEMCVSKPEVITKEVDGAVHEPYELAICDFPEEYMGIVMELMNTRKGRMMQMKHLGSGRLRVEYRVPSRGLVGFRGYYLNDTRGQGLLNRQFEGYDVHAGYIPYRKNGSLVADRLGQSTAYALYKLEERGHMFIGAQEQVYEGMIVGEASRENDINVNVVRAKQLTNIRSAGADEKLILTPKVQLTLEKALEYIAEDELVEITPEVVRIRKKVLAGNQRSIVRGERRDKK